MKTYSSVFEIIRGIIDLMGLYESSKFRRGLDDENRNLRENLQLERMRNLSMEGQVSMIYSTMNAMHEEQREFIRMVTDSSNREEEEIEESTLEDRLALIEDWMAENQPAKLDDETCKECTCNCRGEETISGDMEEKV